MKQVAGGFFPPILVEKDRATPMYRQLYDWFRSAILTGRLRPGQRVPSTRRLASELNVSRITILGAFQQLHAEGYLDSSTGSGTFVSESIPDQLTRFAFGSPLRLTRHARSEGSRRISNLAANARTFGVPILRVNAFRVGHPAVDQFPTATWARLLSHHWRDPRTELLAYGDHAGFLPCREAIADYLGVVRGVRCQASQVIMVNGSQHALEICARVLLNPGEPIWIEEPAYQGAHLAFTAAGARLVPVPVDTDGLDVKQGIELCPLARAAYITPSHQFPLGMTMSASRRMFLLDWAARTGAWIIEDDYDSEYNFTNRPIAALQGLDVDARVIYVGTFSKVLFPSLRLGYLVVPADLVSAFTRVRLASDIFPPTLPQAVLADFIREGHLARHIRRMRMLYLERYLMLTDEIRKQFGTTMEIVSGQSGMHLVALLPEGLQDSTVSNAAAKVNLECWPLSACYLTKTLRGGLILGYGGVDRKEIQVGVRKLASVMAGLA